MSKSPIRGQLRVEEKKRREENLHAKIQLTHLDEEACQTREAGRLEFEQLWRAILRD